MFIISISNKFSVMLPKNIQINIKHCQTKLYTVPFVVDLTFLNTQR